MSPYRTLFVGKLVQDSALNLGGSGSGVAFGDDPLCRDGSGRLVLRGQSLAGALVASARKLVRALPEDISAGLSHARTPRPSRWQVFNAHPEGHLAVEWRQGVGIRQDTGAAAAGVLFDVEVLGRGTSWPFLLEVDTTGESGPEAERIAAGALLEWTRGRSWIGRDVARGLGWLKLEGLCAYRLDLSYLDLWPDSRDEPRKLLDELIDKRKLPAPVPAADFATVLAPLPAETRWRYLELGGVIRVGPRGDGYGLDALSVGGHAAVAAAAEWDGPHYLGPKGRNAAVQEKEFAPDHAIVMTRRNGRQEPFLPGSGLRGPLRHAVSRSLRAQGLSVRDPHADGKGQNRDMAERLFGTVDRSAAILVRDAYLDGDDWQAAWLQHHAEDEFSGSVYESGKFDRTLLVQAAFRWKVVVETDSGLLLDVVRCGLPALRNLTAAGQLPLGGAKWRSAGWPAWTIESIRCARAGEDWSTP